MYSNYQRVRLLGIHYEKLIKDDLVEPLHISQSPNTRKKCLEYFIARLQCKHGLHIASYYP